MTDKTLKERQQALRERRKKLGLVRLEVWVPQASVPLVRAYAKKVSQGVSTAEPR